MQSARLEYANNGKAVINMPSTVHGKGSSKAMSWTNNKNVLLCHAPAIARA